jgi:glyoxylase-like metal-dependent hydrolase (beta-lactamase superfamily II)
MVLNLRTIRYAPIARVVVVGVFLSIAGTGCDGGEEVDEVPHGTEIVIDKLVLGHIQTNCYILRASESVNRCLIIDTGAGDTKPLIDLLKENSLTPAAVIFTHGHFDHIDGATLLRKHLPEVKLVIHKKDSGALRDLVADFKTSPIEREGPIRFAGIDLEVLHTPGHTAGGICLYSKSAGAVFVGDTLFAGSIGVSGSSSTGALVEVIKKKLLVLADDVKVYPGHGPPTTIGRERAWNPFLK